MKPGGCAASGLDGSHRYCRISFARASEDDGDAALRCMKSNAVTMLRVANSLGPFRCSSKSIPSIVGKRDEATLES